MKKLCVVSLAFAVILGMTAFAQYSSKEPAQKDQAAQAPLKSIEGTVKVEGDKVTFVADKDQKSWSVENPEALKGHEGHHVQVKAHVDADNTADRYSRTDNLIRRQVSKIERIAATLGPAGGLPTWIQFLRPTAIGLT